METMSCEKDCPAFYDREETRFQLKLCLDIEVSRRLVEHEDAGVLVKQYARECNAMRLSSRKPTTAFSDYGVETLGHVRNEFVKPY